jgi:hypothetical protein
MPDYRPATAFYRERRHSEAPRGMMPTSCHDGSGTILSGSMRCTRWTWKRYGNSSSFGRYGVPTSSDQPSLAGGNSLRGEKKKQTSRCNLGVKWMVGIAAFAAIAFIRRRLSGHATLELIRATLSQRRRRCQLPFEEPLHGLAEWARHARTEPSEAAELWYRGTVGAIARVYGPGGASVRPRRRVATRVSIVSGIEKKGDL